MSMKKIISFVLAAVSVISCTLAGALPVSAADEPQFANAKSAYVYNLDNKKAVYAYQDDEPVYPTSTVKMMTGILALEALSDRLDETVTVTAEMLSEVTGNNIGLKAGEQLTVRDLIGATLVNGANDAAYVLAYTVSGSASAFVQRMNARAAELGAHNTKYTNPTGIHNENMVTTARDTCTIALYAYNMDGFMDFASALSWTVKATNLKPVRTLYNRNCLLSLYYEKDYYYKKARGMNAGSTFEGGYCVVTTATDGDLTYLAVVMDADSVDGTIYSYTNAKNLLEWAFESFVYLDVLSPDQTVCEMPVTLATGIDYVTLVSKDTLSVFLPSDTDISKEISLSWTTETEELQAPIQKGQTVGRVTAMYNDEPIGTADLIATADISRSDVLYGLYKIGQFTKSRFFIAALVSAVVLSIAYVLGTAYLRQRRKNSRYR